jgi:hypothetical protein
VKKPAFILAQGDRLPSLRLTAEDILGIKQSLVSATAVVAHMLHLASGVLIRPTATITNGAQGQVTISWGASDTVLPGLYRMWLVFTFPGGAMTFPSCPDGEDELLIEVCGA